MRLGPATVPEELPVLRITPMRRRHLRAVLGIDRQVYPRPWTLSLYQGELDMPEARRLYIVARTHRRVIGHAGFTQAADQGHITTVAVDPAWQRRGVAARLLLVLIRGAIDRDLSALTLEVRAGNHAARRLYERFGFAEVGVRAGYYSETGEDAVIMWAHGVDQRDYASRLEAIEASLHGPPAIDEVRFAPTTGGVHP